MLRKIISENESKILEGTKINVSTKKMFLSKPVFQSFWQFK